MTRRREDQIDTSLRYRTVHGHRRAYRLAGDGPAVLLLHGIGDSSESWERVMADLARDHTVLAPDLLGHGGSAKPRADYSVAAYANGMRDPLAILGIESATVVGHSLGGGVAAQIAYQYPELCERLVLVAGGGAGRDVTPVLRLASAPLAEVFLAPARWPGARPIVQAALRALALTNNDLARDRRHVDRTTVEEQGAATQEISRNVTQAAQGTQQVASSIADVQRGASETGSASSQVLASAQTLSNDSAKLKLEVENFLTTVRAA